MIGGPLVSTGNVIAAPAAISLAGIANLPVDPPSWQPNDVHLWITTTAAAHLSPEALWPLLSADERARAERRPVAIRHRFIVARGFLRRLLGAYLDLDPATLVFDAAKGGKPSLAPPAALHFNLSHTDDVVAVALTRHHPLGVDIEAVRPGARSVEEMRAIAGRFFGHAERTRVWEAPAERCADIFYHAWTRQEAVVKAIGAGLVQGLDGIDVRIQSGEPCAVAHVTASRRSDAADAVPLRSWLLYPFTPAADVVGALALAPAHGRIEAWRLE